MPTIYLSEAATFPEAFRETCNAFLRDYWQSRRWELEQEFGITNLPLAVEREPRDEDRTLEADTGHSPLYLPRTFFAEKLSLIARAAAGECDRADGELAAEVYDCCQALIEHLFAVPGLGAVYEIPQRFWQTPIGEIFALAFIWLERDELISLAEAAKISGKSISTISSRVKRGSLRSYPDPREPNPQRRLRVRRSDVAPAAG